MPSLCLFRGDFAYIQLVAGIVSARYPNIGSPVHSALTAQFLAHGSGGVSNLINRLLQLFL
jgi:hypothetical protein